MTQFHRYRLSACLLSVLVSACAHSPAESTAQTDPTLTEASKPARQLSGELFFELMLAEVAVNRRELGAAAALYQQIGRKYDDPTALQRGVALNQTIGNYPAMLELAEKWQALAGPTPEVLRSTSYAQVATGQVLRANASLAQWLSIDPNADVAVLVTALEPLTPAQQQQMADSLAALQADYPKAASLYYLRARIAGASGDTSQALSLAQQSLALEDDQAAQLFRYQLLVDANRIAEAQAEIERLYEQYPTDRNIAIQYTRFLFRYVEDNTAQLENLYNRFAHEPSIARAYARAAFDAERYDAAESAYQRLALQGFSDEANYFLGRIDTINERPQSALNHFQQVVEPPYLISALAEWVRLADADSEMALLQSLNNAKAAYPDDAPTFWRLQASYFQGTERSALARQTLLDARSNFPQDIDLLYDLAMLAAGQQSYDEMEDYLLTLLKQEPNNADALNALGYTWVDLNKNLDLAGDYIKRALESEPDNPAFQDSKGWYLYRLGELDAALEWLTRAFAQMENDEVAAHIAEVLWYLDRPNEALEYRNEVRRLNPESRYLQELDALFNR